ncbi:hypothetical protein PF005_g4850 [Phytophthora fragariae]|uniref:Uncharacterized protein n=1 Tax=Phytophthora fragariae TaxID=53985 RepID=A0A6A3ULH1_9STRA|nr:hypothetical protein PF003_g23424 [Phytophthora fragariae]KAE8945172.1 hypothetical protein PF009_g5162 [Phytophthora fragariae]KAE9023205.1 hypothetical protein PF011_g4100 [Phytophthora fragariae]KAE9129301.1 hypothetical protein PF007_g4937 [Phytophthora fragariae]KAE9151524.1 hypothetical protein PF006_g4187 [Phytophthora fragariae]
MSVLILSHSVFVPAAATFPASNRDFTTDAAWTYPPPHSRNLHTPTATSPMPSASTATSSCSIAIRVATC